MDQLYKWQYLYEVLGKCFIGYQFFVQTINKQGNYKTVEVLGPIRKIWISSNINSWFSQ